MGYKKESEELAKQAIEISKIINSEEKVGKVNELVRGANNQPIDNYKKTVQNNTNRKNTNKRSIKGAKVFDTIKKFAVVGLVVGGVVLANKLPEMDEFKKDAFEDSLSAVKTSISESIGADPELIKIRDNSTIVGSNSYITEYVVEVDGKTYTKKLVVDGGDTRFFKDEIKNKDIEKAIAIVASAQEGSAFDAIRANNLVDKIEDGEVDLDMSKAYHDRIMEKYDNEPEK